MSYEGPQSRVVSSAELAELIRSTDFSGCSATVVGFGNMGKQYFQALRALGVGRIRVCSRSANVLNELKGSPSVEIVAGGFERLQCLPQLEELGIIATPTALLVGVAERLFTIGFRRLLIEKPVSLWSGEIEKLAKAMEKQGVDAFCAYNRVAYPSFHEVRARAAEEGGITSCAYTFTEIVKPDWPCRFSSEELSRWGIANSLHVMSMAHGLIGLPQEGTWHRSGKLSWHPTGTVFVGSGISEQGILFSYHADWGSTGRWSVEVHTPVSSYRLCPLEKVYRRISPVGDWEEIPVDTFAPEVKAGILEEVTAMFSQKVVQYVPLISLRKAAALARYGEEIFGYTS